MRRLADGCSVKPPQGLIVMLAAVFTSLPAHAQDVSIYVVPGKRGVPVVINGVDASYCLIESEFGLGRPGHMTPAIVACAPLVRPSGNRRTGGYFPEDGRQPGYGRKEIEPPPNRRLPKPAPRFEREWSAGSDLSPASLEPPAQVPAVIVDPARSSRRPLRPRLP